MAKELLPYVPLLDISQHQRKDEVSYKFTVIYVDSQHIMIQTGDDIISYIFINVNSHEMDFWQLTGINFCQISMYLTFHVSGVERVLDGVSA